MTNTIENLHRGKTGKVSDKWSSYLKYYDDGIQICTIGNVENAASSIKGGRYKKTRKNRNRNKKRKTKRKNRKTRRLKRKHTIKRK
jgi:hypothetical protein